MAKELYCWRCDIVVPMLNEQEWGVVEPALSQAMKDLQEYRATNNCSLAEALKVVHGQPALRLYHELTGFQETNADAIWHHRLSIYGPPCQACGKPLRTPQASFCAACGAPSA
jgi:hypothetical protein